MLLQRIPSISFQLVLSLKAKISNILLPVYFLSTSLAQLKMTINYIIDFPLSLSPSPHTAATWVCGVELVTTTHSLTPLWPSWTGVTWPHPHVSVVQRTAIYLVWDTSIKHWRWAVIPYQPIIHCTLKDMIATRSWSRLRGPVQHLKQRWWCQHNILQSTVNWFDLYSSFFTINSSI